MTARAENRHHLDDLINRALQDHERFRGKPLREVMATEEGVEVVDGLLLELLRRGRQGEVRFVIEPV